MAGRIEDLQVGEAGGVGKAADEEKDTGVVVLDHGTYANKTGHERTTCIGRGHAVGLVGGEDCRAAIRDDPGLRG